MRPFCVLAFIPFKKPKSAVKCVYSCFLYPASRFVPNSTQLPVHILWQKECLDKLVYMAFDLISGATWMWHSLATDGAVWYGTL